MKRFWMAPLLAALLILGCDDKKKADEPTPSTETAEAKTPDEDTKPEKKEPAAPTKPKATDNNSGDVAHLTEATVKPLAAKSLAGFTLKSFKIKEKTDAWNEIKMTYESGGTEVKVVVNDWVPKGNPEWKTLIMPAKQKTRGYDSMLDKKPDKQTLMVLVGERYRVDFKTRNGKKEQLEKMAEKFDFKALEAMK